MCIYLNVYKNAYQSLVPIVQEILFWVPMTLKILGSTMSLIFEHTNFEFHEIYNTYTIIFLASLCNILYLYSGFYGNLYTYEGPII